MSVFSLLAVGIVMKLVAFLFVLCAIVLVLAILVQKGKGGGLTGALGGAGGAGGILGTKTGDFLTWVTISLVAVFLILAVVMSKFYRPTVSEFGSPQAPAGTQQPAAPQGPGPMTGGPGQNSTE